MVNVNTLCCICNYSVIKTLVLTIKFCSQSIHVVVVVVIGVATPGDTVQETAKGAEKLIF
jgi:hypothetical protein